MDEGADCVSFYPLVASLTTSRGVAVAFERQLVDGFPFESIGKENLARQEKLIPVPLFKLLN
jgi:hypothetical protein